jgi:hypothetical protein
MLDDLSIAVIAFVIVASAFLCAFWFDVFRVRQQLQTSRVQVPRRTVVRNGPPSRIAE